jgi:hypothetical protein
MDISDGGTHKPLDLRLTPERNVRRRAPGWRDLRLETAQPTSREPFEYCSLGARHLLIAGERARRDGVETVVEGLARSTLHGAAFEVDFGIAGSFSTSLRRLTGEPPSTYRRNLT